MRRRQQITRGIDAIRAKLEELSEQEYSIKMEFQKYRGLVTLYGEEEQELREFKQVGLRKSESMGCSRCSIKSNRCCIWISIRYSIRRCRRSKWRGFRSRGSKM